jgi:hypothetical protein
VVNAHLAEEADVYIEDGVVVAVRPNIPVSAHFAAAPLPDWFSNPWIPASVQLAPLCCAHL